MGNMVTELETLPVNAMLKMEGKEFTVQASITFHELYQQSGSSQWIRRGKHSRGLVLNKNLLLIRIPKEEGGKYVWLKLLPREEAPTLQEFYKGGDSPGEWGPARRFAKQGQRGEVLYTLFGHRWMVKDIGAIEASVEGKSPWISGGDRLHFVSSQHTDGMQWLLYLDARPGEASGTGGVFVGTEFNPIELVEEVL